MENRKKVLVIGGSGFIGSHLYEALADRDVVNMDLKAPDFDCNAEFRQGDIRAPEDLKRVLVPGEFDIAINLAAEHKDFGITRQGYFETNESGSRNLLEAATEAGVKRVVFYSSVAVYGDNLTPSHEDMEPAPINYYGQSKLAAERLYKAWAAEDDTREAVIVRPTVVYGERNFANVYRLIKQVQSGIYFTIGSGANIKSMAYVKNLVAATVYLMEHMQAGAHIFNYSDEPHLSTRKIGEIIAAVLQRREPISLPFSVAYAMALPFDLLIKLTGKDLPVSTSRIKKLCTSTHHLSNKLREFGFAPDFDNNQGLARMVKWIQQL